MDNSFDFSTIDPSAVSLEELERHVAELDKRDEFKLANVAAPIGWAFTSAWDKLIVWSWRDLCAATSCGTGGD